MVIASLQICDIRFSSFEMLKNAAIKMKWEASIDNGMYSLSFFFYSLSFFSLCSTTINWLDNNLFVCRIFRSFRLRFSSFFSCEKSFRSPFCLSTIDAICYMQLCSGDYRIVRHLSFKFALSFTINGLLCWWNASNREMFLSNLRM